MRKSGNLDNLITDLCGFFLWFFDLPARGKQSQLMSHSSFGGIYLHMRKCVFGKLQWLQSEIKVCCPALLAGVKIARL